MVTMELMESQVWLEKLDLRDLRVNVVNKVFKALQVHLETKATKDLTASLESVVNRGVKEKLVNKVHVDFRANLENLVHKVNLDLMDNRDLKAPTEILVKWDVVV